MELVCLDTNICIWGIKQQSSEGQDDCIRKARYLIELLSRQKTEIAIPAIVVAELLDKVSCSESISFSARLEDLFVIPPFDRMAAEEYARLAAPGNISKESTKVDRMIVATARAIRADAIYSEDPHIWAIANPVMEVRRLPAPPPEQLRLPLVPRKR